MISMPEELVKRWGPMWPKNYYTKCPWWTGTLSWRRCDGVVLVDSETIDRDEKGWYDKRGRWDLPEDILAAVERIDREHPLEAPPAMEGQVWVQIEGAGRYLDAGDSFQIVARLQGAVVGLVVDREDLSLATVRTWPPPGAVLVAGPTPWGRDVPWTPSAALLASTRSP